jgi:hypothetical protein
MQMIKAAGVPCAGRFPDFDDSRESGSLSVEYVESRRSCAIKLLDPHETLLPSGYRYRFVFMKRNRRQQALSALNMMRHEGDEGGLISASEVEDYSEAIRTNEAAAMKILREHDGAMMVMEYEELLQNPRPSINKLAWFLSLDAECEKVMREQLRPCPKSEEIAHDLNMDA